MLGIFENLGWALEGVGMAVSDAALKADAGIYKSIHASKPVTIDGKSADFFKKLMKEAFDNNKHVSERSPFESYTEDLLDIIISLLNSKTESEKGTNISRLFEQDLKMLDNDEYQEWLMSLFGGDPNSLFKFEGALEFKDEKTPYEFYINKNYTSIGRRIVRLSSLIKKDNKNIEFLKKFIFNIMSEEDIMEFSKMFSSVKTEDTKTEQSSTDSNRTRTFEEAAGLEDLVTRAVNAAGANA